MRACILLSLVMMSVRGEDWKVLFDGKTLHGWMWSVEANPPTPSWAVEDGTLRTTPGKGKEVYLLTRDSFGDFELEFEWKAERKANSGIKYRFQGYSAGDGKLSANPVEAAGGRIEPLGLEYQIADDEANPDAISEGKHSTGALYEYMAPAKDGPARAEVWHRGRIVARGLHIEHWLDGRKVVDVDLDSASAEAGFGASRRLRSAPLLRKQERRSSPIALQIHDGAVWFRGIRVRGLN